MRATINDTEVFLSDDQMPAVSSSVNSLEDPSKLRGVGSTTIRVINTPEAARVLGTEFMAQAPGTTRPRLRIGEGSVDLFSSNIIPVRHTHNEVECIAVGGNASWFEYAKSKKLRSLDLGSSPYIDEDYVKGTWTDDGGYLHFPLIDYGLLEDRADSYNVTLSKLRPAVRLGPVIEQALREYGYILTPKGTLADYWRKPVMPSTDNRIASGWTWDTQQAGAAARRGGSAAPSYTLVGLTSTPNVYQLTGTEEYDPTNSMSTIAKYTEASTGQARRVVVAEMVFGEALVSAFVGEVMQAVLWDETAAAAIATHTTQAIPASGMLVENIDFGEVTIPNGHTVYVGVRSANAGTLPSFDYELPSTLFVVGAKRGQGYLHPDGEDVDIASCCPDLTVGEAIMALVNNRCLVAVTNDAQKSVELWYDNEFYRKPTKSIATRDWTTRMDHSAAPAKLFQEGPRRITFGWEDDKGDKLLVDLLTNAVGDGYGNHVENVETAYGKEVSVKMPFAPTAMVTTLGSLFIPAMRHKDGTYQQDTYDFEPRLLIADGTASGTWTLQATTQSVYPVTYFANNAASGELLGFDNVSDYGDTRSGTVAEYWADRLNRENNTRTLEAYLFIRDHEVQDFDHGMPTLVDDGSGPRWYYVQEIMGHRFGSGEPTKCRLVEIPGATIAASAQVVNPVVEYPEQAFACVGEGYASAVTSGSTTVRAFTSTGYLALRHAETGTFSAYGSGIADGFFDVTLGAAGTWCMWPVNPLGQLTGVVHQLYANSEGSPGLVELHLNGWTSIEAVDTSQAADLEVLELGSKPDLLYLTISDNTALTSLDLSGCDVLEVLAGSGCTSLVDIAPPPNTTLHSVVMVGGALDADSVDGLILKCDDTYSGVLDTTGGTSAAPTGAVAAYIALLTGPAGVGVTGAGAFGIDGTYALSTPLNGRDRYTQTGAFIFWNGSHWRIQNGSGDIYEGTEDVMQPWLVTTWTPVGGTASPAPTVTAPGAGWTIATN